MSAMHSLHFHATPNASALLWRGRECGDVQVQARSRMRDAIQSSACALAMVVIRPGRVASAPYRDAMLCSDALCGAAVGDEGNAWQQTTQSGTDRVEAWLQSMAGKKGKARSHSAVPCSGV
jgi:hypothetical protein